MGLDWLDELIDSANSVDVDYKLREYAYNLHDNIKWLEREEEARVFASIGDAERNELLEIVARLIDYPENSNK